MISEIIKNRRSVFPDQYNQEPILESEIEQLLEAANWAPSHKKTEPWRFKVFQGESQAALGLFLAEKFKETAQTFSEFKYNKLKENPVKAGCIIAICMQRDPNESIPEWEEIAATAMAVQNMWLVAESLSIGAYWSSPGLVKYMGEFINLAEGERCLGFFYVGKYDEKVSEGYRKSNIEAKTVWM
ncbi:nitroreductase family protein [Ulvibacter litoralis]|uniref:Putative NAD(P)H nitroreductase n=1 Tax=Ulvibacter litoralis TaxID=227084 RepID=A0A1G7CLQ7_9FLAO|nr:nitroreductase [Ulvibacter litoralis]GHC46847.1 hypothetical protein GCM10008083_07430 [Ulvibacter litoralis]SDE40298.1 Nitroreductase [Ulvibacter litoralis]